MTKNNQNFRKIVKKMNKIVETKTFFCKKK